MSISAEEFTFQVSLISRMRTSELIQYSRMKIRCCLCLSICLFLLHGTVLNVYVPVSTVTFGSEYLLDYNMLYVIEMSWK